MCSNTEKKKLRKKIGRGKEEGEFSFRKLMKVLEVRRRKLSPALVIDSRLAIISIHRPRLEFNALLGPFVD